MITATRYRILLACVPFPFECSVVATNKKAAVAKAKFKARGLKTGKVVEIVEDSKVIIDGGSND